MAINRNTFAGYLKDKLATLVRTACIAVTDVTVNGAWSGLDADFSFYATLTSFQQPQGTVLTDASNAAAVHLEYSSEKLDSAHIGLWYAKLWIKSNYNCDVSFEGTNTIHIVQRLVIWVEVLVDSSGASGNIADYTLNETYTLSVDQTGNLQLARQSSDLTDKSDDPSVNGFINAFTGINEVIDDVKDKAGSFAAAELQEVSFDSLRSFVFPGAQVFTFKDIRFSDYRDLLCDLTYVKPTTHTPVRGTAPVKASRKLTASCELMQNYLSGELVSPTGKFTALQTDRGLSLVFALDTVGVFHVLEEQSGTTHTGWQVHDLSTTALQNAFPGRSDVVVHTFDVAQSALDGSIGLMMAATVDGTDHLFVSLFNSSANPSWTTAPLWTAIPFDATAETASLAISGLMFAEVFGQKQYLIVDIERPSDAAAKDITRYVVNPAATEGSRWAKTDIPVDVESTRYQSCVGRIPGGRVDGVYTSGTVGEASQLVYVPLENPYGDGPPEPVRLSLPSGMHPTAIAAARDPDPKSDQYGSTDLYAVSDATLYRYDSDDQSQGTAPSALVTNGHLAGTDTLFAMTHDGVLTLWGKNGSDVVYYLACPTNQLSVPGAWTAPVPVLTGIERLSPYVNRADGGRTVFAAGGGNIQKLTQGPSTASSLWRPQRITLAAAPTEPALSFNSYTTTLQVIGADKLPVRDVSLAISSATATPVYMNGLYYVLGSTPVTVQTDAMGTVTVIEATDDLQGTPLTVTMADDASGTPLAIRPLDTAWKKLAQLNTSEALRGAHIPTDTVAGGVLGSTAKSPLVDASVADSDVQTIAATMDQLGTAWSSIQSGTTKAWAPRNRGVVPATLFQGRPRASGRDVFGWIAMEAGDLFRWLETGVEALVEVIKDAATDAWHFIAHIAGEVYAAVLDTVEAIVGAVKWVFNVIKTAIEAIIRFVQFLFEWDDIRRTKNILHNLVTLFFRHQISQIPQVKTSLNASVAAVEKSVNEWADITDWSALGTTASQTPAESSTNPMQGQTSGSQLLAGHLRNHASDLTVVGDTPSTSVTEDLVTDLLNALSAEAEVLGDVYNRLQTLATDFHSLSVEKVLQRLVGILVDGALSSAQVVVDALLDLLQTLADDALSLLDAKIHIPVISDILNALGVADISFLDLFSWIAAVAYTVVYKVIEGEAPFPDDANSAALIAATSWDELVQLFSQPEVAVAPRSLALSTTAAQGIFVATHAMGGFTLLMSNFLTVFEAESLAEDNVFAIPSAVIQGITTACVGAGDFLVPKDAVEDEAMAGLSTACTVLGIAKTALGFTSIYGKLATASSKFPGLKLNDGRAVGAVLDVVLVIPQLVVTGWHFHELAQKDASADRSAAIVGEVASLAGDVSTVSYAVAVNDDEEESRQVFIGIMVASNVAGAGLLTAESIIH
ncbi:hypothetical protein ASPCADRAFT_204466 [Aspergillus carbonarius ITEM 5010]|uniref:Uncharacterized protein n=1 Tax=Aspergillus carbonarius (strain ITEM 5010) TaxID=602072 RepID=A0A1R3RW61_ASPC5|nr:hypothetical protein ASPCADRAFT_204466 [Aspergillus carbonarius ITEM 5010]